MDTLSTIKQILKSHLDIPEDSVTPDSTFESLQIDSLDTIELICALEEELDIDLGDPEGITTVSELVDYIDSLPSR